MKLMLLKIQTTEWGKRFIEARLKFIKVKEFESFLKEDGLKDTMIFIRSWIDNEEQC